MTLRFPIHTDFWCCSKPIAWFNTDREAAAFVNANLGSRNLYIGEPMRVEAEEQIVEVEHLGPGRIAA